MFSVNGTHVEDASWIPHNPPKHLRLRRGHQPAISSLNEEQVIA